MSGNVHSKNLQEKIDGFIAAEYKYLYESLPSMDKDMQRRIIRNSEKRLRALIEKWVPPINSNTDDRDNMVDEIEHEISKLNLDKIIKQHD